MNIVKQNAIYSLARGCALDAIKHKERHGRITKADVLDLVAPYREPVTALGVKHFEFMYYVGQQRNSILGR